MAFIKFLINRNKGQATIEYLILTALIIGILALSVSNFFPSIKKSLDEKFFQTAVKKIIGE